MFVVTFQSRSLFPSANLNRTFFRYGMRNRQFFFFIAVSSFFKVRSLVAGPTIFVVSRHLSHTLERGIRVFTFHTKLFNKATLFFTFFTFFTTLQTRQIIVVQYSENQADLFRGKFSSWQLFNGPLFQLSRYMQPHIFRPFVETFQEELASDAGKPFVPIFLPDADAEVSTTRNPSSLPSAFFSYYFKFPLSTPDTHNILMLPCS